MKFNKIFTVIALAFAVCAIPSFAQSPSAPRISVEYGMALFGAEKYKEALEVFNAVLLDPKLSSSHPEALYWCVVSCVAIGDLDAGLSYAETFLKAYPNHARIPDVLYQQGRILYMKKNYEASLQIFNTFLSGSPNHDLYASGLFWSAECMFFLGKLDEAERVYRLILEKYPKSVKVEAATYRLAIIELKYREEELLMLLKWSHEESLRLIEEYQRREKTYEQALAAYQKQLVDEKTEELIAELQKQIADLQAQIDVLMDELAQKDEEISALKSRVPAQAVPSSSEPVAEKTPEVSASDTLTVEQLKILLELKARALDLLWFYIDWLSKNAGGVK